VDNGVWEVGLPTTGPRRCYGRVCAATVLHGNYPEGTASRLISPSIQLPRGAANGEIYLFFSHWFSYAGGDGGYVQISIWETGGWSAWINLGPAIVGNSGVWTRRRADLTPYFGKKVQIAFYHTDCTSYAGPYFCGRVSGGWYVDNVTIETTRPSGCSTTIVNE
jgi:hypothetical protein